MIGAAAVGAGRRAEVRDRGGAVAEPQGDAEGRRADCTRQRPFQSVCRKASHGQTFRPRVAIWERERAGRSLQRAFVGD